MLDPRMLLKLVPTTNMLHHLNKRGGKSKNSDETWKTSKSPNTVPSAVMGVAQPKSVLQDEDMTEERKLLLNPLLYGFSLGDKTWGKYMSAGQWTY